MAPSSTRRGPSRARARRRLGVRAAAAFSGEYADRQPVALASAHGPRWPPKPALRSVLREPRIRGTSMPPATASQLRRPAFFTPGALAPASLSVWPAATGRLQQGHSGTPSRVAPKSSPVRAMRVSASNCSSQPPIVSSRPAAPSALPTSRLANVERQHVERAARADAELLMAAPAQVLHRREHAGFADNDHVCTPLRRSARGHRDARASAIRPWGRTA